MCCNTRFAIGLVILVLPVVARDASAQECTNDVPGETGYLATPTPIPGGTGFCTAGQIAFTIDSVPQSELDELALSGNDEVRYRIFGLGNSSNRNHAQAQIQWYAEQSQYIVKLVGGACVECNCCYCNQTGLPESVAGWCANSVGRSDSPTMTQGSRYVVAWDSATGMLQINGTAIAFPIPTPFAFDTYCLGSGCTFTMWNVPPNRLSAASVSLDAAETFCSTWVVTSPPSCPCDCDPGQAETQDCGDCGTRTRTCPEDCRWAEFGACAGPDPGVGCDTGLPGECAAGIERCVDGYTVCRPTGAQQSEICGDGADNDCNGEIDESCADGGPASDGGSAADGSAGESPGTSSGCDCRTASAGRETTRTTPWVLLVLLAALAASRRRRHH